MISGALYSIYFFSKDINNFGTRYQLGYGYCLVPAYDSLADGTFETDYMVHFPTLLKLAKKEGLEMMEITNFLEFFEVIPS